MILAVSIYKRVFAEVAAVENTAEVGENWGSGALL